MRSLVVVVVLASASSAAAPARADLADDCARAAENAQKKRRKDQLRDARVDLVTCARAECPVAVRKDCATWLAEVDLEAPTLTLHARDDAGAELRDVRVVIDGAKIADAIPASAVRLDPGDHVVRGEYKTSAPFEAKVRLARGDRAKLDMTFTAPAAAPSTSDEASPASPQAATKDSASEESHRALTAPVIVLAGIGVVGLAGFIGFGLSARSAVDNLHTTCAPNCSHDDVQAARTKALIADVSGGVAVLGLGLAAVLFFTQSSTEGTTVSIAPLPGAGAAAFMGRSF